MPVAKRCRWVVWAAILGCVPLLSCRAVREQPPTGTNARTQAGACESPVAKPELRDERRRERPPAPKPILLHAKQAVIHGKSPRYEFGKERDNIGCWTDGKDWVSWDFSLAAGGTYRVQVAYACPTEEAGSEYEIAVGDRKLRGVVKDTKSWGKFITEPLGVIELPAGNHTLACKPTKMAHTAVVNLQSVLLVPGRWDKSLVASWGFEEGTGTETLDGVSGSKDAVRFARWTRGALGTGLKFNAFSSHVRRPAASAPRLRDAFTIEAWVRPDPMPLPKGSSLREGIPLIRRARESAQYPPEGVKPSGGNEFGGWRAIVSQHDYPLGYYFGPDGGGDLSLQLSVGGRWLTCASQAKLPVGRWSHVAATFDKRSGAAVYIDGAETGQAVSSGPLEAAEDADLLIGGHSRHAWAFRGVIDEVRIYNRVLAPDELREHYRTAVADLEPPPPPPVLKAVRPDKTTAKSYERVTLELDLEATYDNPFDVEDVLVEAVVAAPSQRVWWVPGFLYQPFERTLEDDHEELEPTGPPRWQVRLAFRETGVHHVIVRARDRAGFVASEPLKFNVESADVPGLIRRSAKDSRYFVTERGESFFPVGANLCWGSSTFTYDEWLERYAENGCNFIRVWLSPFWVTFGMNTAASGSDAIDQAGAWRFDHVLAAAERLGIRVMPAIDSFNILRPKEHSPGNYEDAPYAHSQGGPLLKPPDYFTNPWSLEAYRNRLRYLVARYGHSPALFAWEFWNEVDLVGNHDSERVAAWHADMARHLRAIDPWQHLLTTSVANPKGDPALDALPELDFLQTHHYGAEDEMKMLAEDLESREAAKTRPLFLGEFGIADRQKTGEIDPTGIHLHNALYACVGQGHAGTPMTWWWDSYVDPKNLYPIFGAFARWVAGFDFVAQKPRTTGIEIVCGDFLLKEPTILKTVGGAYKAADFNQPLTVGVDREGVATYAIPPSGLLHGLGFHKALHNPVTFELDAPAPGKFGVEVSGASGYGDSHLQISLDGKLAFEKKCPVPEGNKKDVLHDGDGVHEIDLPAGKHTVKVENTGTDWLSVASYRIPWLTASKRIEAPLRGCGVIGETMALAWVQNRFYTWKQATAEGFKPVPAKGGRLDLSGLRPGRWKIEHWDTVKGQTTKEEEATVGPDGKLSIPLPEITWDAAFRLKKE